jgi:hypothetical protein
MLPWSVACEANWLREEQSTLTAWEKSAKGIVGEGETSPAKAGRTHPTEGLNGACAEWHG